MEKENNSGINIATIVFCLIIGFGWTLSAFFESSLLLAIAFCVLIIGIIATNLLYNKFARSIEALERRICKQLDKSGFHYEKKEGDLYVTKNECHFQVQLADSYNKGIKHLYVLYRFKDDNSRKSTWTDGAEHPMPSIHGIPKRFLSRWRIIFVAAISQPLATPRIS